MASAEPPLESPGPSPDPGARADAHFVGHARTVMGVTMVMVIMSVFHNRHVGFGRFAAARRKHGKWKDKQRAKSK